MKFSPLYPSKDQWNSESSQNPSGIILPFTGIISQGYLLTSKQRTETPASLFHAMLGCHRGRWSPCKDRPIASLLVALVKKLLSKSQIEAMIHSRPKNLLMASVRTFTFRVRGWAKKAKLCNCAAVHCGKVSNFSSLELEVLLVGRLDGWV